MHCSRCQGLMRKDHLLDMEGGFGEMWAQSWRCVNCGAVHDAVIAQNRWPDRRTSWYSPVVSHTLRKMTSIWERKRLSVPRHDHYSRGDSDGRKTFRQHCIEEPAIPR